MAHKHSKSKHSKKHKKEKKRKKEKKSKKEDKERSRKYSSSSSSSSSTDEDSNIASTSKQQEWNFLESALNRTSTISKEEKVVQPTNRNVYEPRSNPRELNPYWKNNGTGLPSNVGNIKSKNMFLKPGDDCSGATTFVKTHMSNWRKKDYPQTQINDFDQNKSKEAEIDKKSDEKTSKVLTNDELNAIAAKLVKAEILGNKALVEKLKGQLEGAKKAKEAEESDKGSGQAQGKYKEVVIVTDSNVQHLKQKYQPKNGPPSKKQKLNAQNEFMQENSKYSLQNMFLKEKTEVEEDILRPGIKVNNIDEFDDVYLDAAASEKSIKKREKRKEIKTMNEAIKKHKSLEGCSWCIDNRNDKKHLIVSTGSKCYLCLPEVESLTDFHCIIVPIQHEMSTRKLDEDVWDEIKTYQKLLTQMFSEKELDVVFFESARSFKHFPHCYIQCVPLDRESGDMAAIYFQKAISESETEWSNNKKVIDFRNKDLTRSIPKDLPYFAVSFGTEGGFAHLIEDEQLFPRNFAEEIIGGMLDLDPARWRKPSKQNFNAQREKTLKFLKIWKKYEFNKKSHSSDSDSESDSSD